MTNKNAVSQPISPPASIPDSGRGCGQSRGASGKQDFGGMKNEKAVFAQEHGGDDGEIVEAEEEEDTEPKRLLPTTELPTQEEIDSHQVDHVPFRSWC